MPLTHWSVPLHRITYDGVFGLWGAHSYVGCKTARLGPAPLSSLMGNLGMRAAHLGGLAPVWLMLPCFSDGDGQSFPQSAHTAPGTKVTPCICQQWRTEPGSRLSRPW